jgi:hypothetical protein
MSFGYERRYRGRIQAVLLDWVWITAGGRLSLGRTITRGGRVLSPGVRLRNRLRHPSLRESQPCGLRTLAKGPLRRPRSRTPGATRPVIVSCSCEESEAKHLAAPPRGSV